MFFNLDPVRTYEFVAEWLEHLAAHAIVATVLGLIPASSDTVESEGRQMKQCWGIVHKNKNKKKNLYMDSGPRPFDKTFLYKKF